MKIRQVLYNLFNFDQPTKNYQTLFVTNILVFQAVMLLSLIPSSGLMFERFWRIPPFYCSRRLLANHRYQAALRQNSSLGATIRPCDLIWTPNIAIFGTLASR